MDNSQKYYEISGDDLRAALSEMKTYIDITEEDLKKIYEIALKHAKERVALKNSVHDVMTREVKSVTSDASIDDAAKIMSDNKISGLPVVDDENHVVGVVSEADILSTAVMGESHTFRDILRYIIGEPLPGGKKGTKVGEIMSSPAIIIKPDTDIREVSKILNEKRIKRLPVVNDENKLIGIISRADIVRAVGK